MTPPSPNGERLVVARSRAHARRSRVNQRGIALPMVIGAIVVLSVVLSEFQTDISAEVSAATSARDAIQAEYMARSGINLARLLIATEPTVRASVAPLFAFLKRSPPQLPVWEFADKLLQAFYGETADDPSQPKKEKLDERSGATLNFDASQGRNLKLPNGHFELTIVDEDAKINMNQGASNDIARIRLGKQIMGLIGQPQFAPLFEQRDTRGNFHDQKTVCQALIDWADVDETAFTCDFSATAQSAGTEDAYYALLPQPYRRKNAPYDSLEELRLVRGISEDLWSTFIEPDPSNPKKRVATVWGQGAVNINTANAQTLLAIVCSGAPAAEICVDASQSATFLLGVTMARGISMGAPLFGSSQEFIQAMTGKGTLGPILSSLGMKPVKFQSEAEFAKSVATESKMFSIYAVGVKKGYKRETRVKVHAVVDFRTAPPLAAGTGLLGAPGAQAAAGGAGAAAATPQPAIAGATGDAIAAALKPSAGGQFVYFRLE
jgi:general secretion pathway protein K